MDLNVEDILGDSLVILGLGEPGRNDDSSTVGYGDLVLSVAPKEGKAITLLADHLFSPALLLAERIERGLILLQDRTVIELGAGCALPTLLAATLPDPPSCVVVTDYPDPGILGNLQMNVRRNEPHVAAGCTVHCRGHDWGTDVSSLLALLPRGRDRERPGYDVVILSDLLHFHSSHAALVASIMALLRRRPCARAYAAAGTYTAPHVCENFLLASAAAGVVWEEGERDGVWRGSLPVRGVDATQLGERKGMCRWWTGRWKLDLIE